MTVRLINNLKNCYIFCYFKQNIICLFIYINTKPMMISNVIFSNPFQNEQNLSFNWSLSLSELFCCDVYLKATTTTSTTSSTSTTSTTTKS